MGSIIKKPVKSYTYYYYVESKRINGKPILRSDLGINSFELVQIVCEIEDAFGIEIPDRVIGELKMVKCVLDYIESIA